MIGNVARMAMMAFAGWGAASAFESGLLGRTQLFSPQAALWIAASLIAGSILADFGIRVLRPPLGTTGNSKIRLTRLRSGSYAAAAGAAAFFATVGLTWPKELLVIAPPVVSDSIGALELGVPVVNASPFPVVLRSLVVEHQAGPPPGVGCLGPPSSALEFALRDTVRVTLFESGKLQGLVLMDDYSSVLRPIKSVAVQLYASNIFGCPNMLTTFRIPLLHLVGANDGVVISLQLPLYINVIETDSSYTNRAAKLSQFQEDSSVLWWVPKYDTAYFNPKPLTRSINLREFGMSNIHSVVQVYVETSSGASFRPAVYSKPFLPVKRDRK
jgi:hypothetical protein